MATPALLLLTALVWPRGPEACGWAGATNEWRASGRSRAKSANDELRDRGGGQAGGRFGWAP